MRLSFALIFLLVTGMTQLPSRSADTYKIDTAHSSVNFVVPHLMVSKVNGNFQNFDGTIVFDVENISKSSTSVFIKANSINTSNADRDQHLKGSDFFDVAKYPEISFKSSKIQKIDDGYVMLGQLTMHGVTKNVSIPFKILGTAKNPFGKTVLIAEGSTKIKRSDYGIKWNKDLDNGGVVVGEDVTISLDIEAIKE
ncbi:MAG: YceI family protein [Candidatus Caenarcaniphilales bacterium]|nr:YceI family protein [Candidatus Caenarcaniphilales bacterium]